MDDAAGEQRRAWRLRLICCGRSDGYWYTDTWEEADAIRNSYVTAYGHDRAAIIEANANAALTPPRP